MKNFLLSAFVLSAAFCVSGQGQIYVDNTANNNPSPTATANGLFFLNLCAGPVPINLDFNLNLYGGADSANLTLLKTFVGPTATGGNAGPGWFSDPGGVAVPVPGATASAFFRIEVWLGGDGSTYAGATTRGSTPIFVNPVSQAPNLPPTLTGQPAVVIETLGPIACPEPSSLALASLGAAFLFFRRRK